MTSLKSGRAAVENYGQQPIIGFTSQDEDTSRQVISVPVTTCPDCGGAKQPESTTCFGCYQKRRDKTITAVCARCGVTFPRPFHQHAKALRKNCKDAYCTMTCARAHHAVKNRRRCRQCGEPVQKKTSGYCSEACRKEGRAPSSLESVPCGLCGTPFRAVSHRTQYCSPACKNEAHALRMIGAGNSHFKGGRSYALWFDLMRPLIIRRDEGKCVACGVKEFSRTILWRGKPILRSNLIVHHVNEDPADNRPENLLLLCQRCHLLHHKSAQTPFPWFDTYLASANGSMTSKWRAATTSLLKRFSSTTV